MSKVFVSLSGGLDSTTVLAHVLAHGHEPVCYWFNYGSKHNPYELEAVERIANVYDIPVHMLDLRGTFAGFTSNLLQSGGDIPEGHYTDATMSRTVVPGRNAIFIAIAAGLAESRGAEFIALGIHQGDHAIYPDCRREFFKAMDTAIYLSSGGKVQLMAPFLDVDKRGIVTYGLERKVPYILTRTCYKNQVKPCGKCGACVERLEAFAFNNVTDPVEYE